MGNSNESSLYMHSHITNMEGPFSITGGAIWPIVVYDADNSALLFDGTVVTLLAPGVLAPRKRGVSSWVKAPVGAG
jgi:hypothetical protein